MLRLSIMKMRPVAVEDGSRMGPWVSQAEVAQSRRSSYQWKRDEPIGTACIRDGKEEPRRLGFDEVVEVGLDRSCPVRKVGSLGSEGWAALAAADDTGTLQVANCERRGRWIWRIRCCGFQRRWRGPVAGKDIDVVGGETRTQAQVRSRW